MYIIKGALKGDLEELIRTIPFDPVEGNFTFYASGVQPPSKLYENPNYLIQCKNHDIIPGMMILNGDHNFKQEYSRIEIPNDFEETEVNKIIEKGIINSWRNNILNVVLRNKEHFSHFRKNIFPELL